MDNGEIKQQLKDIHKQKQALYLKIERICKRIREIINYTNKK